MVAQKTTRFGNDCPTACVVPTIMKGNYKGELPGLSLNPVDNSKQVMIAFDIIPL